MPRAGEVVDYIRFNEIVPDQLDNIVLINHYGALSGPFQSLAW